MDLRRLRFFLAVVESGSLHDAARAVHLSQPALGRQIRLLEDEVGAALFDRQPRGMRLTSAGTRFEPHARALLHQSRIAFDETRSDSGEPRGTVAVGVPTSLRSMLLTPALATFVQRCPHVQVIIGEGTSRGTRDAVAAGQLDVGIAATLEDIEPLSSCPLVREPLYLIGPRGSWLDGRRRVQPRRLESLPLALTARPNALRTVVDHAAVAHGQSLEPRFEVESLEMALDLVRELGAWSVFPVSGVARAIDEGRVAGARLAGMTLTWALVGSRERPLSMAGERLRDAVIESVASLVAGRRWPGAEDLGAKAHS